MAFMVANRTLRGEPGGEETIRFTRGTQVTILPPTDVQPKDGWVQIKRGGITGWVLKDAVGDTSPIPPDPTVDLPVFFTQCWMNALRYGVFAHYLAGVAKLRSDIQNDTVGTHVGVFRFLQAEWDAARRNSDLKLLDFSADEINDWGAQCTVFSAMVAREFEAAKQAIGRPPSAHELYLAQLIGSRALGAVIANPDATVLVDLGTVQDSDLPVGGLSRNDIMTRYSRYLVKGAAPAKGSEALDLIAEDLQHGLDLVRDDIVAAGDDVLSVTAEAVQQLIANARAPAVVPPPSGDITKPPDGPVPGGVAGAGGTLGQLISRGEGDYGTFNRGNAGDSPRKRINFGQMTIGSIMALQALPKSDGRRLFAVGKYQVIPVTMRGAVAALGIGASETFGPSLQEKVFRNYLIAGKRPKVKAYITGQSNDIAAAELALALEFASVADPNTGRSHYGGSGGNRASIKVAEIAAALNAERARYDANRAGGMSPNDAWIALSPGIAAA